MKVAKLYLSFVFTLQALFLFGNNPGTFHQVSGSPFAAGSGAAFSSFSPEVFGHLFSAIPNYEANTVSVYQVDPTNGVLTEVSGSPFATGGSPAWQAYSPLVSNNLFSAVANQNDNTVSVYAVDQTTGAFNEISGSPFATGVGPLSVEFSPLVGGNLFAAATNAADNTVSVYLVDQSTGSFTEVEGSPFATGSLPNMVSFSPDVSGNLFAAIANYNEDSVTVYQVDVLTGQFTEVPGGPFSTQTNPYAVRFSPLVSGNLFAAAVNLNSNTVSVFRVNETTGALAEISGSPFSTGSGPNELAFSPDVSGTLFAAIVNFNSNNISVFDVNESTGTFIEVAGSPVASGSGPDGIAFSPLISGNLFAIVANFFEGTASAYKVDVISNIPSLTQMIPSYGPVSGGSSINITGTGFTGATAVHFGSVPATSFTVNSKTSITAVVPAAPQIGYVAITVTTPNGTSAATLNSQFCYTNHYLFLDFNY